MIETNKFTGELEMTCDSCCNGDSFEGIDEKSNYLESILKAKEAGWLIRLINGKWLYFCSRECLYKYKDKN